MSYEVQELHDGAITILDELSDNGTVDRNKTKEYENRAPKLTDMWHREWTWIEGVPAADVVKITSLTQTVQVSDRNCPSCSYYLAMHYALADQNTDLADVCRSEYETLKRKATLPATIEEITDVYGYPGGD